MNQELVQEVIHHAHYRLDESTRMIRKSFDLLEEEDIWVQPNKASNSIGNLILHLCGNIRQYAIAALSEAEDTRERDKEFLNDYTFSKKELLEKLTDTLREAKMVIASSDIDNFLKKRNVQGFHFSGFGIVMHVVEHYSYHTGQIALLTKFFKNKDLGFYDGMDLTATNE